MREVKLTSQVRRVYNRPAAYIHRSDTIREPNEAARRASERVPIGTVPFVDVSALRTSAGRIARINKDYRHAREGGLVADKARKLMEGPTVQRPSLRPSCRDPIPYPLEVFQSDTGVRVMGLTDNALTDYVVRMFCHPLLFTFTILQELVRRLRSPGLKPGADAGVAVSETFQLRAGVSLTRRVNGNILDTEIDSDPILRCSGRRLLDIDRGEKKPFIVPANEIGFTLPVRQECACSVATSERDGLSAFGGPDGNLRLFPAEYPIIVSDGSKRLEGTLAFLVKLVRVGDLRDGADDHLRGEPRRGFHGMVRQFVELVLPKRAMLPGHHTDLIRCRVGCAKRLLERVGLFISRKELDLDSKSHTHTLPRIIKYGESVKRRIFLRQLKQAFSNPIYL